MPALIQNLNVVELLVIGVVAVLVFGRRLPEVARQAAVGLAHAKRSLQELRRQSGIDDELREARRSIAEVERSARTGLRDLESSARAPLVPERPPQAIRRGANTAVDAGAAAPDVGDAGRAQTDPTDDRPVDPARAGSDAPIVGPTPNDASPDAPADAPRRTE